MTEINAKIVADSINIQGDRITTMMLTFPRFILAELNTHRMFSKNSASSRAIPFNKMVESVENNPFIPIAWQNNHKGMQGNNYITDENIIRFKTGIWLNARDKAVQSAEELHYPMSKATSVFHIEELKSTDVTKQLCNRLLEPFMWHTVILTATEFDNFFELRCPQYEFEGKFYKSKKDAIIEIEKVLGESDYNNLQDYYQWASINRGDAEIHMMALAEAMWDARNESTPKLLQPGEWHIPFRDKIDYNNNVDGWARSYDIIQLEKVKISTGMSARTSYTVVGDEKEFIHDRQIELHDRLISNKPLHASPMEHNARAMTNEEYQKYVRGKQSSSAGVMWSGLDIQGWCRNFKGFIQYRELIENK